MATAPAANSLVGACFLCRPAGLLRNLDQAKFIFKFNILERF